MLLNLDRHVGSLCVGRAGRVARPGAERRGDKRTGGGKVDGEFADPRPEMMTMHVTRSLEVTFSRNFMMQLESVIRAEKEFKTRTSAREKL